MCRSSTRNGVGHSRRSIRSWRCCGRGSWSGWCGSSWVGLTRRGVSRGGVGRRSGCRQSSAQECGAVRSAADTHSRPTQAATQVRCETQSGQASHASRRLAVDQGSRSRRRSDSRRQDVPGDVASRRQTDPRRAGSVRRRRLGSLILHRLRHPGSCRRPLGHRGTLPRREGDLGRGPTIPQRLVEHRLFWLSQTVCATNSQRQGNDHGYSRRSH